MMDISTSGTWLLDAMTLASFPSAFVTCCCYCRYLLLPLVLVLFICHLWPHYVKRNAHSKIPPGNFGWPIIGETVTFLKNGPEYFSSRIKKHGMLFSTHLITQPMVVVVGPEYVRQILYSGEDEVISSPPPGITDVLGEGSFYSTGGEDHRFRQRCLRRNYTEASMSDFVPQIQNIVRDYLSKWCKADSIFGVPEAKSLMLKVVSEVLMGLHFDESEVEQLQENFEVFVENFFSLPYDYPGSGFSKTKIARRRMLEIVSQHISRTGCASSFLDIILHPTRSRIPGTRQAIPDEYAQSIFVELLFGSNETTASTLCALIRRLTQYPEVTERVREEVREHFEARRKTGDTSDELTYDSLKHMPYVNDVLKEVLRVDPPISAGFRKAVKDIEIGGYVIPAGWGIMYCIANTHEESTLFSSDNRMTFEPARWEHLRQSYEHRQTEGTQQYTDDDDEEEVEDVDRRIDVNRNHVTKSSVSSAVSDNNNANSKPTTQDTSYTRHHYIPFGEGPRRCIGQQFAKILVSVLIIELCSSTSWKMLNPKPFIRSAPIPFPADNMPMVFNSRSLDE